MWSDGQAFAQATTELFFEPYASKTFTLYWPGTLADGTHLPPGRYQARGTLVFEGFEANPLRARANSARNSRRSRSAEIAAAVHPGGCRPV